MLARLQNINVIIRHVCITDISISEFLHYAWLAPILHLIRNLIVDYVITVVGS